MPHTDPVDDAIGHYLAARRDHAGPLVVGVSGGRDSVALAVSLGRASPPGSLVVAHVHHHLRGVEADQDAQHARELAHALGTAFELLHVDARGLASQHSISLQAAARAARYRALGDLVDSLGADALVVGHTRDDQLETLVMHILRGTGVRGLAGMRPRGSLTPGALDPENRGLTLGWNLLPVHRPLLTVTRQQTGAYCRSQRFPFRDDSTNRDPHYLRTVLREFLMPRLVREQPELIETLSSVARCASETLDVLNTALDLRWPELGEASSAWASVDVARLRDKTRALLPYMVKRAHRTVSQSDASVERSHLEALDRMIREQRGAKVLHLPGNVSARMNGGVLSLKRLGGEERRPLAEPLEVEITLPARVDLPDGRVVLVSLRPCPPAFSAERRAAWLDPSTARGTLRIRRPRTGDRYWPLGAPGSKRLSRILIDRKVPRSQRVEAVVLEVDGCLAWVSGLPTAEWARVPKDVAQALRVELMEHEGATPGNEGGV